mmetsp:Transcript_89151/g.230088  ORF Transcript_89151/g.230088 Transcript_89151/m.230088 type:complete len:207 (-) Transcript_89151:86-706(-)
MGLGWSGAKEVFGITSHYESYAYKVVEDFGSWTLRRYEPAVAAETHGLNADKCFMTLARYIGVFSKGENVSQASVAMTTPVVNTGARIAMTTPVVNSGSEESMSFILPSQYQKVEDAPVPTNPNIRLVAVPAKEAAALVFSGNCRGMEEALPKYQELLGLMKGRGLIAAGPWELHRHNPPYTLPMFRTNEVVVPVARERTATSQGA